MKPPKGFRDLLPADYYAREFLKKKISETYEQFGYMPIDTPVVENVEVLLGKGGGENEKLMFKILKRGAKLQSAIDDGNFDDLADMGLRYDLTVPLARYYAANRNELPAIFKRYHIAPVWRADRPQHGRFREFVQCDVDVIGSESMAAEADVICATATCLSRIGFSGLRLHLNNRPLVSAIAARSGVPENLVPDALRSLDKIDRFGIDGAAKEMLEAGIPEAACDSLKSFFADTDPLDNQGRLDAIQKFLGDSCSAMVASLREIISLCPPMENIEIIFDPFLVRGMDYYTGPIFEVRVADAGFSIAGGGRYDGLVGTFSGANVPATGFSIGFERILVLMKERGMFPEGFAGIDAAVLPKNNSAMKDAMKAALKLRQSGLRVDVSLGGSALGKMLQQAEASGARYAVIVTADATSVELKNLKTRESQSVDVEKAATIISGV